MSTNVSLWCSWLLDSGTTRYYFAGDTGYFHGFREFGRKLSPIDVAILPIGGTFEVPPRAPAATESESVQAARR